VAENFSWSFAPVGSFTQDAFAPLFGRATCVRAGQDGEPGWVGAFLGSAASVA
jgi:hypothetical protein